MAQESERRTTTLGSFAFAALGVAPFTGPFDSFECIQSSAFRGPEMRGAESNFEVRCRAPTQAGSRFVTKCNELLLV